MKGRGLFVNYPLTFILRWRLIRSMNTPLEKAIEQLGGQAALSRELGVSIQVIGNWLARGVPVARCPDVERVTAGAVRCEELQPDVDWAVLRRLPHKNRA